MALDEPAFGVTRHELLEHGVGRQDAALLGAGSRQLRGTGHERVSVRPAGALPRCIYQQGAAFERDRNIGRIRPAQQVVAPGQESVDPGRNGVFVAPDPLDREDGLPAVVGQRLHRCLRPVTVCEAILNDRADAVVAVAEDRRGDLDLLTDRALDGKSTGVDLGSDALDDDPLPSFLRMLCHERSSSQGSFTGLR